MLINLFKTWNKYILNIFAVFNDYRTYSVLFCQNLRLLYSRSLTKLQTLTFTVIKYIYLIDVLILFINQANS